MTQATAAITKKFTRTFCRIGGHGEDVQKAYFALGFRWYPSTKSGDERHVKRGAMTYIGGDDNYHLGYSSDTHATPNTYDWNFSQPYREVTREELLTAAEEVRKIKRQESKASKKRKAQRKWDATATKRTTENCPVRRDVIVAVKLKDGEIITEKANWFDWSTSKVGYQDRDIVSYKVLTPNKHKPASKVVSLDEMFAGIATGLGKGAAVAVGGEVPTDLVFTPEPAYAPVGDVNSNARGSGARFNSGKPDYSLIPMSLLEGEARVWAYGARKYKAWNWMKGMDWNVPFACAMRHMAAWQRGEDIDPETGESHLDHAMCNLRMLRYYADYYKEGDNRPKEFFNVQAVE